jgi:SAM-dependent methyltransferase
MALQLEDFLITGRTFDEYAAFFSLDTGAFEGQRILDCPGGVSGFVAEAVRRGADAHACDPLYAHDLPALTEQACRSIDTIYADPSWMAGHNMMFYGSVERHRTFRTGALEQFALDYPASRYRCGALPQLPYEADRFDLVLCSHLLFVYDDRLDAAFHLDAVAEMLRVGREVRIFSLVDFRNSRRGEVQNFSPMVAAVRERFGGEIVKVGFEFQPGADAMLRIGR